jgi:hypothetical protein
MFRRLPDGTPQVSLRPPTVYLDHCALRGISKDPQKREHIRKTFETRGTLIFSVVNMIEMARNSGQSYTEIRDTLDSLGPFWVPSDPDPATAMAKEMLGSIPPKCYFPPIEVFGHIFRALPKGTFSLGTALDTIHDANFREGAKDLLARHPKFLGMLRHLRDRHLAGEVLPLPTSPPHSLLWIQHSLGRLLATDGKKITANDAVDLLHAIVPLRYAMVLVFDSAWADFSRRMGLQPGTHVFNCKPKGLELALECIRTIDISGFEMRTEPDTIP